jgi:hypothetical protein
VDVLLEVLAFLHVEAIFAGAGLNTGSSLLSRLIARHHPALRRLFRRGPRAITEAKWEIRAFPAIDGGGGVVWYVRLGNVGNDGNTNWCHQLPLPTVPAIVEILEVLGDFTVKCESPLTDPKVLIRSYIINQYFNILSRYKIKIQEGFIT